MSSYESKSRLMDLELHTKSFVESMKELMDVAIKSSMSLSHVSYMDAEELAAFKELNKAVTSFEAISEDYIEVLKNMNGRFDEIDKLDSKMDSVLRKLDRLDSIDRIKNK